MRDVKLTLPYAKLIAETLIETYEYIETFPTKKEREDYLKQMEKSLFEQYKPILKRFSRRQARVLVKLIQRETHQSSYDIRSRPSSALQGIVLAGIRQVIWREPQEQLQPKEEQGRRNARPHSSLRRTRHTIVSPGSRIYYEPCF